MRGTTCSEPKNLHNPPAAAALLHRGRPDASAEGRTTYSTTVLLGRRDEPLLALAARQLVEAAVEGGYTR